MKTKRLRKVLALSLTLMISSIGLTSAFSVEKNSAQTDQATDAIQKIEGSAAQAVAPEMYKPVYSSVPPDVRPNHLDSFALMEDEEESINDPNPNHPVAPPDLKQQTKVSDAPLADSALTIFQNSSISVGSNASVIDEPAHATNGKYVFFTGNWYAAKSSNGGAGFAYLNPYADFPDFCCDQDVVQDPARNLIIWFRQGVKDNTGVNKIKIGASTNGGVSFATYTYLPTGFDPTLTGQWIDYPHLAMSNNFLYLTINTFNGNSATGKLLIRIPLNELAAAATIHPVVWKETTGVTWTPVQGAREIMYLGSPFSSAGQFKVYSQPESSTNLTSVTKTIPAWTSTTRNSAHCLTPNGRNPCGRTDHRLTAGWVSKGVIGFFWNVKEGGGFPYPYINAATFKESDKSVLGRPYIFNTGYAFQYGAAAPNARGDIGIACFVEGGSQGYPRLVVGMDDDYTAASTPWALGIAASSTNWGLDNGGQEGSGDYLRVRAHNPAPTIWTTSAYIGTGSPVTYVGKYVVFGRERETRSWNRWKIL
jgi:hypothetical protein